MRMSFRKFKFWLKNSLFLSWQAMNFRKGDDFSCLKNTLFHEIFCAQSRHIFLLSDTPDLVPFFRCAKVKAWGPFLRSTFQKRALATAFGPLFGIGNRDVIHFLLHHYPNGVRFSSQICFINHNFHLDKRATTIWYYLVLLSLKVLFLKKVECILIEYPNVDFWNPNYDLDKSNIWNFP